MPIVSSEIISASMQADGRFLIKERHVDHTTRAHDFEYVADVGVNIQTIMTARAVVILESLKEQDLYRCIFSEPWNYVLVYATNGDLAGFVRELYRNASRETLAQVAARLLEWIANGRFTDLQIRTAFSLTSLQWTTLKTKMQTLVNNYNAVQAAAGE